MAWWSVRIQPPVLTPPAKPATLAQCHEVIDTLGRELAKLREQVAWLQERVQLDSRDSSKPPSLDEPASGSGNRAQRRSSCRPRCASAVARCSAARLGAIR
jgi:hypothetical protein